MYLTKEDFEFEWSMWGEDKPWYCKDCKSPLAPAEYSECNGTDPEMPKESWEPHEPVQASDPVSYKQFCEITLERVASEEEPKEDLLNIDG